MQKAYSNKAVPAQHIGVDERLQLRPLRISNYLDQPAVQP